MNRNLHFVKGLILAFGILLSYQGMAQNVQLTSYTFPNLPATSCTNTNLDINATRLCINITYNGASQTIVGNTINVNLDYTEPSICLGALAFDVYNLSLGMIPAGVYTVNINIVINSTTVSTTTTTLTVNSCCGASPGFTATKDTACIGDSVYFANTSTGATSQTWYENNVQVSTAQNYGNTYPNAGTYAIKLVVSNGTCSDSLTRDIIVDNPSVNLGPDPEICPGDSVMLDAGAGRDSVIWSDMSRSQINYVTPGTHYVTVYENGCEGSDTITVNVTNVTPVDLGPDSILCYGDTLTLDATKTGATYVWQDASTNATFQVTTGGTYYVAVTDLNGCVAVDSINITMDSCTAIGLNESTLSDRLSIYPNPASDVLNIEVEQGLSTNLKIEIYNLGGALVLERTLDTRKESKLTVNLASLAKGVYLIQAKNGDLTYQERLVIQ